VTWPEALLILVAGLWAGTINAVVGSGTLVTFPVLVALGYSPLTATMSNGIGLVAGGVSGVWGYRSELAGQRRLLRQLIPASLVGGLVGAVLLLELPESGFDAVVPALIVLAIVLVLVQPSLQRRLRRRSEHLETTGAPPARWTGPAAVVAAGIIGVYGGYFTAAQGVLLVGVLGSLLVQPLQTVNGIKNVLSLVVNIVSAVLYTALGADRISWAVAGLIAVSSLAGGWLGSRYGRRLPPVALRAIIVVLGLVALTRTLGAQVGWW
jgi:uncharacterized membrane protein YfcA